MKRFVFSLAIAFCFLTLVSQHSTVSAKDNWVSIRTKNFLMVGNANEKEVRKVALKLEQFREVFTKLFPHMTFNTPVPTTVIVFKDDHSYGPFKLNSNNAGYFQPGPDVNYIAVRSGTEPNDTFDIIFHEYTHLLVNNTFKKAPVWFNEGLAEYYSSFSITDDQKFGLGIALAHHVHFLRENRMLPLRTLFEVDHKSPYYNEGKKMSVLYAQSWALMHYLLIGTKGNVEKLGKFLNLIAADVPTEKAFTEAFQTTYDQIEKELREYVRQSRYNYVKGHFERKLELDTTAEAKPLTDAEAQAYLGDLLLHSNRKDAEQYLERALKLDPNLGIAHASMGMLRFREGKTDEARASLERAVAASSQNYLAHYYYAYTLSRRRPEETTTSYTPEQLAKIREHLQRAIALRPDFPEPYSLLAFVSLVSGNGIEEAIASMKRVIASSPGRNDFVFMLAQLQMRNRDYKTARTLLEQVANSNADEDVRQPAARMLAQLDAYEKQLEAFKDAATKSGAKVTEMDNGDVVAVEQTTPTAPADPSTYLREVLRAPAAGETQLQATLVKIECDAKGIVFVFQTPAALLRLSSTSFDGIELTTYSPDVKGQIACGPRKPENVVIICYVPGADKRAKTDGVLKSLEFVPADFKLKPVEK
ncbi:MAG TPA: tetratricopeptide repeat protein [Pyrinomonadaceae bacterium]|nr:tetratricopeptide repeat protein [Pyrinomonadaceae bacterium]